MTWLPRRAALPLVSAVVLAGCAAASGSPGLAPTETPAAPTSSTINGLPVDPAIQPVSVSSPSPDAAAALERCGVAQYGIKLVAGMGLLAHASDLPAYAPMTGLEPELASDRPTWLIQFRGELPMPTSREVWVDPICVVIDGEGGFFATGPVRHLDTGTITAPPAPKRPPTLRVPPLAP
jgi:hypothetical protein